MARWLASSSACYWFEPVTFNADCGLTTRLDLAGARLPWDTTITGRCLVR